MPANSIGPDPNRRVRPGTKYRDRGETPAAAHAALTHFALEIVVPHLAHGFLQQWHGFCAFARTAKPIRRNTALYMYRPIIARRMAETTPAAVRSLDSRLKRAEPEDSWLQPPRQRSRTQPL